jgi:hypothetical protein
VKAIQLVAERVRGKARANMEVSGPDGEELQILNMTDHQIDQRIAELVGFPGRGPRSVLKMDLATGHYLAGVVTTSLRVWSLVMRSSILETNFGARLFTICRMSGPNSWKRLIPASLPIVEPKVLNVPEVDRLQYGR